LGFVFPQFPFIAHSRGWDAEDMQNNARFVGGAAARGRPSVCMNIRMNIRQATRGYDQWMRRCTTVVEADIRTKHARMRADCFLFLRGTYYRWAQLWPSLCADLRRTPRVLAVGDLHVNSFGTWRDAEGRLAWGVDDFDEAYPLPYANDLVRLAASLKVVIDAGGARTKLGEGCDAILESYRQTLRDGGAPIVLAEREHQLERLGIRQLKAPNDFWEKLNRLPAVRRGVPATARAALRAVLPGRALPYKIVRREAGLGSLGQQRFVAIAQWEGGRIAREAKALVPSASAWLDGARGSSQPYYARTMRSAVRAHDPYQRIVGPWLIRRLSPDANPIDIEELPARRDATVLLGAMGTEAANVHLGTPRQRTRILQDLARRKPHWLRAAAKAMAKAMEREWRDYAST
jgi:hypothetical protein